jgi:hypothetical protein
MPGNRYSQRARKDIKKRQTDDLRVVGIPGKPMQSRQRLNDPSFLSFFPEEKQLVT